MDKQIIYVGDPMCSWCWGFSPVKRAIEAQCAGRAETALVVGGLHPYTTEPQDAARKDFLRHHWQDVGGRTGQPFSYEILERDDFVYDTEPASRAAVTMRHLHGNARALDFFAGLQRAFYADNADITQPDVLAGLAGEFGVDRGQFAEELESEEMRKSTASDFEFAHTLGVSGFPTVVVKDAAGYAYLTVGYQPYEQLQPVLEAWLTDKLKHEAAE